MFAFIKTWREGADESAGRWWMRRASAEGTTLTHAEAEATAMAMRAAASAEAERERARVRAAEALGWLPR